MKRKLFTIVMALVFLLYLATPAYAWNGTLSGLTINNVHFSDTYAWAKNKGFSSDAATKIAQSCDGVDLGWRFFEKARHLDRRIETGDTKDTRAIYVEQEMKLAKEMIRRVPGSSVLLAKYYREQAYEHLGRGLHSIQDTYAHMDAGAAKKYLPIYSFTEYHHGMKGVKVQARFLDGTTKEVEVEQLYDNVLWDYTSNEGWHLHEKKEDCSRWLNSKESSEKYLYDFLLYGYGPSK